MKNKRWRRGDRGRLIEEQIGIGLKSKLNFIIIAELKQEKGKFICIVYV